MSENTFTPPTHTLRWPIEDDKSQPLTHINFKTLSIKQHNHLVKQHKGKDKALERAIICESTGLTLQEMGRLVTADFNTIQHHVFSLTNGNTGDLLSAKLGTRCFNPDKPQLLIPIQGDDGQDKTQYSLKPPTLATTDIMESYDGEWEKTLFISASCTGFTQSEIESMSLPDFNQLQDRLVDFLQQSADFFPQETSTS